MRREGLALGEAGTAQVHERVRAGRTSWRARCYIGTYDGSRQLESTSSVSEEDALAKLQLRVEQTRGEGGRGEAVVVSAPLAEIVEASSPLAQGRRGGLPIPTLGRWLELWLKAEESRVEASTLSAYALQVRNWTPAAHPTPRLSDGTVRRGNVDRANFYDISGMHITEVTADDLRRALKSMACDGSWRRAELAAVVVRQALDEAVVRDVIPVNPMARVTPWLRSELRAARKGKDKRKPALKADAAEAVTAALLAWEARPATVRNKLGSRLSDLWIFMLGSGLRIGEALAIRLADYDREARTVTVTGTLSQTPTLHRKAYTKSHDTGTTIPISQAAADALDRTIHGRRLDAKGETIFTNRTGDLWAPSSYRTLMRRALEAAGVEASVSDELGREAHLTPHTARRTVGTWIANSAEGGVMQASQQLRHSSTAVTESHYIDRSAYVPQTRDILDSFGAEPPGE